MSGVPDSSIRASRLRVYVTPAAQTSCPPMGTTMEEPGGTGPAAGPPSAAASASGSPPSRESIVTEAAKQLLRTPPGRTAGEPALAAGDHLPERHPSSLRCPPAAGVVWPVKTDTIQ